MPQELPQSVLFCCDHNAVRSPMAEGIMKMLYGTQTYVQSAGVQSDMEIDGFAIAACAEIGVELSRHRTRDFDQMATMGDDLSSFDVVVALSPVSEVQAREMTRLYHLDVLYWPISDPTQTEGGREQRLCSYRATRDEILERMTAFWGAPEGRLPQGRPPGAQTG